MKEGDNAKTLKAVKTILKTIEKAHRNIKVEKEPSGNKKPKEQPTPNTTDTNKCRLIGHNHTWKNSPNNPASKNYNGTHYSKIREQECASTTAPGKTNDKSTNSDDESKRPHKKTKHRNRRREVSSLDSTDSNNSVGSPMVRLSINSNTSSCDSPNVKWDQACDSIENKEEWDRQYLYSGASEPPNLF